MHGPLSSPFWNCLFVFVVALAGDEGGSDRAEGPAVFGRLRFRVPHPRAIRHHHGRVTGTIRTASYTLIYDLASMSTDYLKGDYLGCSVDGSYI